MPDPIRPSWSLLTSGQMDAQWIEIDAVVRATDGSHLLLASENGQLMATIRSASVADVKRLVDASGRVRGICMAATDERGQMQGIQLVVPSMEFIEVRQPPGNGFALTPRPIDSLFQVRGPNEFIHKIKVSGVLTYFGNNNYFVQDKSGSVMAIAKQDVTLSLPAGGWWSFWQSPKVNTNPQRETELEVGDQVEVVGFPEMRSYAPALTEAIIHKVGGSLPATPVKTTVTDLAKGNLDSTLVSLDGLVVGSETLGANDVLQIQADQKIFQAFLPFNSEEDFQIASGTKIKITGICQMEPATHAELGKSPSAFSLLLRNAHDISILERPPRLTARQALLAVGISVAILIGSFIWIRLLHQQVEVRTQQLKREIAEHEKTEALLDRKTQLLRLEIEEHKKTESTLAEKTVSLEREIDERKNAQLEVDKIHRQLLTHVAHGGHGGCGNKRFAQRRQCVERRERARRVHRHADSKIESARRVAARGVARRTSGGLGPFHDKRCQRQTRSRPFGTPRNASDGRTIQVDRAVEIAHGKHPAHQGNRRDAAELCQGFRRVGNDAGLGNRRGCVEDV